MHELGTVMYIIRTVEDCCRENQLTRVASVTLQVGEVSGILPKYLSDCWDWAVKRTEFLTEAALRIEPIRAVTLCTDCGQEYSPSSTQKSAPVAAAKTPICCGAMNTQSKKSKQCSCSKVRS